jgi:hypothetical protein
MQNLVSPSPLTVIDQIITRALDERDRAALTGLGAALAALAALAVLAPPADMAKLQARADAAVRFCGGRANV